MLSPCRIFSGSAEAEIAREKSCDKEDGGDGSIFSAIQCASAFLPVVLVVFNEPQFCPKPESELLATSGYL